MLETLRQLDQTQEAEQEMARSYKKTFLDALGNVVFQDMLWDLYFLRPAETPEQQALCNYAKTLIAKVYGQDVEFSRLQSIFRKLFRKNIRRIK